MKIRTLCCVAVGLLLAADNAKDDAKKALQKFEGTWRIESLEVDGNKTPDDEVKRMKLTIEGEKYSLMNEDTVVSKGTIKVDGSKKPMTIDITVTEGDNSGTPMLGIYEIDGDKMKVCYARPNEKRPTKLTADAGTGNIKVVAEKQKKTDKKDKK